MTSEKYIMLLITPTKFMNWRCKTVQHFKLGLHYHHDRHHHMLRRGKERWYNIYCLASIFIYIEYCTTSRLSHILHIFQQQERWAVLEISSCNFILYNILQPPDKFILFKDLYRIKINLVIIKTSQVLSRWDEKVWCPCWSSIREGGSLGQS